MLQWRGSPSQPACRLHPVSSARVGLAENAPKPAWSAPAHAAQHTTQLWPAGSNPCPSPVSLRTLTCPHPPPNRTCCLPASNCGLMSTTISPRGCSTSHAASSTLSTASGRERAGGAGGAFWWERRGGVLGNAAIIMQGSACHKLPSEGPGGHRGPVTKQCVPALREEPSSFPPRPPLSSPPLLPHPPPQPHVFNLPEMKDRSSVTRSPTPRHPILHPTPRPPCT